ncbi:MAG: ABC transporter permease [Candidatus Latescibacterota bacterium]
MNESVRMSSPSQSHAPLRKRSLWKENFAQALHVIKVNRMRSSLLILGVAIGVTTILAMVTVLTGLQRKINKDLVSANRPYLIVQKFDMFVGGVDEEEFNRREGFDPEDADALEVSCPALDVVCYSISPNQAYTLHYGSERTPPLQLAGMDFTMPQIYSLFVETGRFYSKSELLHRERVVVLGYGPAQDLFPNDNPIGKVISISNRRYQVIGVFAKRKHFIGALSDNYAVIPYTSFRKDFMTEYDQTSITANIKDGFSLEEGQEQIVNVMRVRRVVRPGKDNNFAVITSEAFLDTIGNVTIYVGLVLIVIASIGLVVGGIGVMNIMLISVAERTREIGVRMAIGANKRDIAQQFLVEAATLTGIGGIVGTLFGTAAAVLISRVIHFPFYFSVRWTLVAVLFSALVGVVFGLYPARRAAHLDPVTALHYE